MQLTQATSLNGTITVPADKSISHRSVMFGAIAHGTTRIHNFLRAEDCLSTLHAFTSLGVAISDEQGVLTIDGKGFEGLTCPKSPIDVGNSGTTMRLLMGILAGCPFETTLYGDDSLNKRPMNRVIEPLKKMGAAFVSQEDKGLAPITITGTTDLVAIDYQMPVASAQVKSAILFAALQAQKTSHVSEKTCSRNHTEEMIQHFGGKIAVNGKEISLTGPQNLHGRDVIVPGDISSAAFFLVAGTIVKNSSLILKNVGVNPTRTGILDVLETMGASVQWLSYDKENQAADLKVTTADLKATKIAGELIPRLIDELPVIALLATQAQGTTIISDAQELKVKETNRIDATAEELQKMGADITPTEDGLVINGPTPLHGAHVSSRGDHRIGMMLQIAALIANGSVDLEKPEAIAISYPSFFNDIDSLLAKRDE